MSPQPERLSSFDIVVQLLPELAPLLDEADITEVMVNQGGQYVYVEQAGRVVRVEGVSLNEDNLAASIISIASQCGTQVSEANPALDARLKDGSRVAAMLRPCSPDGPTLTIRKFGRRYALGQLVASGSLTPEIARMLQQAVRDRKTILISGGTGTGKTTLLNALTEAIPPTDRIVLIEETSEIHVAHRDQNLVRFESRPEQEMGFGPPMPAMTIGKLLRASLRHRPDRILLGEVRGPEAYDLLQCLNTGHQGSLSTIHANSAGEALTRLSHLVMEARTGLASDAINEAIGLAIHLVVHIERNRVTEQRHVCEVISLECYQVATKQFVTSSRYPLSAIVGC